MPGHGRLEQISSVRMTVGRIDRNKARRREARTFVSTAGGGGVNVMNQPAKLVGVVELDVALSQRRFALPDKQAAFKIVTAIAAASGPSNVLSERPTS